MAGFDLEDDRRVVLKVHRWKVTVDRLVAVQEAQVAMADAGIPAPRPIGRATSLGSGVATIEEFRSGDSADGHDPAVRRSVADGLEALVRAGRHLDPVPDVGPAALDTDHDDLWPEPHDLRFDFDATTEGAEWIDELAIGAVEVLAAHPQPPMVAHLDWRVENLGFRGDQIVAIYDWDSLALTSEAVAVGHASASFSTDWARAGFDGLPSVQEMHAFVIDYEERRGRSFDATERAVVEAANLRLCAHGARCQHSDVVLVPELAADPDSGWLGLLRLRVTAGLW